MLLKNIDVPYWLRFPNIINGYRLGGDMMSNFKTLFSWHNETINAWTMIMLFVYSSFALYENSSREDLIPYISLYLSSALHMPFSLGYHLFMPISETILLKWRRLDFIMTLVSICLQNFALNYFIYISWITYSIFALNFLMVYKIYNRDTFIKNDFDKKKYMKYILRRIIALMCFSLAPIVFSRNVFYIIMFFSSMAMGSVVYIIQFPEKYFPGKFDIIGSSHQIMHLDLLLIHYLQYKFVEFNNSKI